MTNSIKAIVYDVDGTLVDTEPLHNQAWDKALQRQGRALRDLTDLFVQQMAGKKPISIADVMVKDLKLEITPEQLLNIKTYIYLELIQTQLNPIKGAIDSIKRFKKYGLLIAIGTSLDTNLLKSILHRLQINHEFDVIVTSEQVKHGKPDPETYMTVMKQLNISPENTLIFEDAESGIVSAKAAGAWCVAIRSDQKIHQNTELADETIKSFDEATIEFIKSFNRTYFKLV